MQNLSDGLFKLYSNDIVKNIINVIGISILLTLITLVKTPGFDLFKIDYVALFQNITNVSFAAVVVDLARRFLTNSKGSLLNVAPEDKPSL